MNIRLAVLLLAFLLPADAGADSAITGDWVLADGSAVVRVEPRGDTLSARIVALLRPRFSVVDESEHVGNLRRDIHNPDTALRDRPVIGIEIATGLKPDGATWRGQIYDPGSGKTYSCIISAEGNNSLRVRGYVGFSALGRTMYWQRLDYYRERVLSMLEGADETR